MKTVEQILADLVAIPSLNPMGRGLAGPEFLEKNVAAYVADFLRKLGLDVEVFEVEKDRPNVLARLEGESKETLLLEAHMDTVLVDNMQIAPFDPAVRDGRMFGRGTCDTKSSLAAILALAQWFVTSKRKPRFTLLFMGVADEEYRLGGSRKAMSRGLRADMAVVGEPTNLGIVHAHKGVARWRVKTHGVAAHSALPNRGRNAIYGMGRVLCAIESYAEKLQRTTSDHLLGPATISVGVISGGQTVNTVPDECTIEIDRRLLPGETSASVLEEFRRILPPDKDIEISEPHIDARGLFTPPGRAGRPAHGGGDWQDWGRAAPHGGELVLGCLGLRRGGDSDDRFRAGERRAGPRGGRVCCA